MTIFTTQAPHMCCDPDEDYRRRTGPPPHTRILVQTPVCMKTAAATVETLRRSFWVSSGAAGRDVAVRLDELGAAEDAAEFELAWEGFVDAADAANVWICGVAAA